jgi:prepilin-type N-terminal cleavage/methylation domain-containing protein
MVQPEDPAVRWSDFCRRADAGFTLIEIVVAIAIVGLALTFVLPRLSGLLDRLGSSMRQQRFEDHLAALGSEARRTGRTVLLRSTEPQKKPETKPAIELPSDWFLVVDPPITFSYNGMCTGGTVRLSFPGGERRYQLVAPYCRVEAL